MAMPVCGRYFWQRFPGILPRLKATEAYRRSVFLQHWDGVNRSRLSQREGIGSGTVERWFQDLLQRKAAEKKNAPCPRVLGIDEHFFTRRRGYATTFCDLRNHKVYDVVLGRSELALEPIWSVWKASIRSRSCAWIWPPAIGRWSASTSRMRALWRTVFM